MFNFFNKHQTRRPELEIVGIEQHPLKLKLDFLNPIGVGEVDDNRLVILPLSAVAAEEGVEVADTGNGNLKEIVKVENIPKSTEEVGEGKALVGLNEPGIGEEIVEVKETVSEVWVEKNIIEVKTDSERVMNAEIECREVKTNSPETSSRDTSRIASEMQEISQKAHSQEHRLKRTGGERKGASVYQSQLKIHGHHVNLLDEAYESGGGAEQAAESNKPKEAKIESVTPERVSEAAASSPVPAHGIPTFVQDIQKKTDPIKETVIEAGAEKIRTGAELRPKLPASLHSDIIRASHTPYSQNNNKKNTDDELYDNEIERERERSTVIKPYTTLVLNDYMKPSPRTQVESVVMGSVPPSATSADMVDVDVPPGIEGEINDIKPFGIDFNPSKLDVIDSYTLPNPIESPTAYIVKDGLKLRYLIKEPKKPSIYGSVRAAILRNLDLYNTSEEDPVKRLNAIVGKLKKKYSEVRNLSRDEERAMRYHLFRDFIGYREIDVPMNDDNIEDITCVGYGIPVFIYHQKYYNLVSDIVLHERELDAMVLRLAQEGGKHISISDPLVDATLRNGTRAQLTFKKTATEKGSTFTLRRFRSSHITPTDLIENGTYTPEAMAYLWKCVQSGKNILIVGGTATGKTTNLNVCSLFIPPDVKIVSIEDTREIKLYQKNWIPSATTRNIDTFSLLKAALRQRPEYIIVGEVRGKEAQTLFQAMASGHVVMSTFHAGSVIDTINRLTNAPIEVSLAMLESLNVIVVLKNEWTGASSRHRFADAIYEQRRISGVPRFVKIYSHEEGLSASLITPEIEEKIQCLSSLLKEGVRNPDVVSERIMSVNHSSLKGRGMSREGGVSAVPAPRRTQ